LNIYDKAHELARGLKQSEAYRAFLAAKPALATDPDVRLSAQMLLDYADASKEASALPEAKAIYARGLAEYSTDP